MKALKKLSPTSPLTSGSYLKSYRYFFNSTKTAAAQVTDLFDFVWPTVTALWNLRWEVSGYLYQRGEDVTKEELNKKFVNDEKFIRPNLYRSCIEFEWDDQKEQFAKVVLINLFAYHESWIENLLSELGKNTKPRQKGLQFPSTGSNNGVQEILAELLADTSPALTNAFYSTYSSNKKFSLSKINNLLHCYRYFKECRNSLMHSGGFADQKLVDASNLYDSLSASDLNMKVKPEYVKFNLNDRVELKIQGVVGFTDIILQLITSIDAELLKMKKAEDVFIGRLNNFTNNKTIGIDKLPKGKKKAIRSIIQQSGFAKPSQLDELENLMKTNHVIK